MTTKQKNILKYALTLLITAGLFYIAISQINPGNGMSSLDFLVYNWNRTNKFWLLVSGLVAVVSHTIRAERWKILLKPLGYSVSLKNSFLSVMVGYFINLLIPRGGEISRCLNLFRLEKVPVNSSIGTVVAERVIDVVFLAICIGSAFLIELDTLTSFFQDLDMEGKKTTGKTGGFSIYHLLIIGAGMALAGILTAYIFYKRRKTKALKILIKIIKFVSGIKEGLLVVFKLEKNIIFIIYSLLIWVMYYLMCYTIFLAFPETAELGPLAAMTIFVIGGIAMAMPLPGGMGSYHLLVAAGLTILYQINESEAFAFATIFHFWQTVVLIVIGAFSFFFSQKKSKSPVNVINN